MKGEKTDMTFEELQKEAKKQGYKLIKKHPYDIFRKALKELEADGFKVKETLTGDFLVMKGE